jgi:hypothetical protein
MTQAKDAAPSWRFTQGSDEQGSEGCEMTATLDRMRSHFMTSPFDSATRAVRAALESDTQHGAVVPPLHLSSNYTFDGFGNKRRYDYCRSGNPTRDALATALTDLEGGAGTVVTSSGMAALTLVAHLLEPGELLLAPHDCYGGTYRLFEHLAAKGHFEVAFVDQTDPAALRQACARAPKLILVETPSNPLLRIVDIRIVAAQARECGALLATEASEFGDIYKLDVVEIPTNRPVKRLDIDDEVYRTANEKYGAIIADIEETHRRAQPVLVGT